MGGAAARVEPDATAFPDRTSAFAYAILAGWQAPSDDDAHRAWVRDVAADFADSGPPIGYVNFDGDPGAAPVSYSAPARRRLAEPKRRYEPANLFHLKQNAEPSA